MSEMVDRVARAIIEATGEEACDLAMVAGRVAARAAIAAMREPTQEQYDALCATDKMWRELSSEVVWKTYIDAVVARAADDRIQFSP